MPYLIPWPIEIPPILPELPQAFLSSTNPPLAISVSFSILSTLNHPQVSLGHEAHGLWRTRFLPETLT